MLVCVCAGRACYPDRLINSIPNLYYYAANNPSGATIAKRRSSAATISYLTPPAENAGVCCACVNTKWCVVWFEVLGCHRLLIVC